MLTFISFIIVLGVLVFVHELGHFLVAKRVGVRCEVFSLGFGPTIFKKKWGETTYQIAIIPLGGFVKMSGEDPAEELEEKKDDKEELEEIPPHRKFHNQPVHKRLAIVLAGPFMNIVLAFLLVPIVYMMGIEVDSTLYEKPVIGFVEPESPAAKVGLQIGDLVLKINGKAMSNWKDTKTYILFHPDRDLDLEFFRNGSVQNIAVRSQTLKALGGGTIGIQARWPSIVKQVLKGKPAEKAGLKAGDVIIRLADIDRPHWFQTQDYIQKHAGQTIALRVLRGSENIGLQIVPEANPEYGGMGFIGIEPDQFMQWRRFGLLEALKVGTLENIETTYTTFLVVGKLLTGQLKIKAIGGPVQIAEFTGAAAQEGLTHLLLFMAFISVQLGVLNLLPIPVLDGGHVFFMLVEALKGSPLSIKKRLIAQQVGFGLLVTLMVVVTFHDVARHQAVVNFFSKLIH